MRTTAKFRKLIILGSLKFAPRTKTVFICWSLRGCRSLVQGLEPAFRGLYHLPYWLLIEMQVSAALRSCADCCLEDPHPVSSECDAAIPVVTPLPSRKGRALHATIGCRSPASRSGKPSGQMDVLSARGRFSGTLDEPKNLSVFFLNERVTLQANTYYCSFQGNIGSHHTILRARAQR